MRTRFVALVAAVIAVVMLLDVQGIVEAQSGRCYLGGHLYNRNREIGRGGIISAECPSSFPITIHDAPFGNWGVSSRFGRRRDGNQFAGWKSKKNGRQRQWNSCTTHAQFFAPNPSYYNVPADVGWWQRADPPTEERVNSTWFDRGRNGQSCRARWEGQVYTFRNLMMYLYELDPVTRDARTAMLNYGDVPIRLRCSSTWICEGNSGWMQQQSVSPFYSRVSAQAYVVARTARK